eukprot:TRINITY_DN19489_c0_g1_i1.p1 TRINITY_DN19489_c0_g1~~TRINITY_DN19489_c0_g1_i1.p1  ORF type:complete len:243 (-),score=57.35 TRINITY_DN19489_c0_g1_i1:92-820(-)
MASSLSNASDENVFLVVTHSNLKNYRNEMKFSLRSTVATIKERLWRNCGTSIDHMLLQLFDENNQKISDLTDDSRPLGFYSPQDGYHMRIVDLDPSSVTAGGWLEDTSLVEKYHISEDAYEKRDGTFRKFKEKLIAQNPSIAQSKISEDYMQDLATNIQVGQRCEVDPGGKRGVVMFVGQAETLAPGYWIGVKYDEPVGKHDGMVKGKRYFSCPPLHGAMLRPDKIKVGDYPERDPFEDEEI